MRGSNTCYWALARSWRGTPGRLETGSDPNSLRGCAPGAIDPIGIYRASGNRAHKEAERPQTAELGGGIV